MGVYEIITGITKNEENLKVEIRQTEGTLERNLVYIKNTKTNRAYSFTLADGDEYGADAMTRNAVARLHSDMYGCNEKTLDRIEHALGIKLETWQCIRKKLCHRPCKAVRIPSQSWHRSSESDIETECKEKKGGWNAMELKGQVTISIEDFEKLKAATEQKEYAENRLTAFKDKMSQFYEIEDTEFWKQVEEIDSKQMTDRQIDKALSKARETLKIVVDTEALKKTIRSMINKKDYPDNDTHIDLSNTTDKELKAIEICFREQED